jgi:hypothetical protein
VARGVLPYYVVAIATALYVHGESEGQLPATWRDIQNTWTVEGHEGKHFLLTDRRAFDAAITICADYGLIEPLLDEFGPPVYVFGEEFGSGLKALKADYRSLFHKYDKGGHVWLSNALENIMIQSSQEKVGDAQPDDWQPIPVERADALLDKVTSTLDDAIEAVRADNGYAANHPEERQLVLDSLKALRSRLTEDVQISWMYVREFGLKPLGMLIERLGKSSVGLAASAAREAIVDWLKQSGMDVLRSLIK